MTRTIFKAACFGVLAAFLSPPLPASEPAARSASYISVGFSRDGALLATAGMSLPIRVWDVATGEEKRKLSDRSAWASPVFFTPEGALIAADAEPHLRIFPAEGRSDFLMKSRDLIPWPALSPDGRLLAGPGEGSSIAILDLASRKETLRFAVPELLWGCAFSPDGRKLAALPSDGTIRLWSVETGKELLKIVTKDPCYSLAFSPDGKAVAGGSITGSIRLWDASVGNVLQKLEQKGSIMALAFSPDGGRLAAIGLAKSTKLWDLASGKELRTLAGGDTTLAFSPDGKLLAAGGSQGPPVVWIWEAESGKELRKIALR